MPQKLTFFLLAGTLLVACGSGGAAAPNLESASLIGTVVELDGQTLDRSGVEVTLIETGATAVTGTDGRFSFPEIPTGTATLAFGQGQIRVLARRGADDDDDGGDDADDDDGDDDDGDDDDGDDDDADDDDADDDDGDDDDGDDDDGDDDDADDDDADDDDADDDGNPLIRTIRAGDKIEVRIVIRDGEVVEFRVSGSGERKAIDALARPAGSLDLDVTGKVKVESDFSGDEEFEVEVEHLAAGTVMEVFLADPETPETFISIGTAPANALGEAELEFETEDGDALPLSVSSVDELRDFLIEVRLATTGALLLFGTVPALPAGGSPGDDTPGPFDRSRGRSRLTSEFLGAEGHIDIRSRPEDGRERFKIEAEHLAPGTIADFFIEDPDGGPFVRFGSGTADAEGEIELSTNHGLAMPLGATHVADLVGLAIRVERDDGQLLLTGTVPPLVAD